MVLYAYRSCPENAYYVVNFLIMLISAHYVVIMLIC